MTALLCPPRAFALPALFSNAGRSFTRITVVAFHTLPSGVGCAQSPRTEMRNVLTPRIIFNRSAVDPFGLPFSICATVRFHRVRFTIHVSLPLGRHVRCGSRQSILSQLRMVQLHRSRRNLRPAEPRSSSVLATAYPLIDAKIGADSVSAWDRSVIICMVASRVGGQQPHSAERRSLSTPVGSFSSTQRTAPVRGSK